VGLGLSFSIIHWMDWMDWMDWRVDWMVHESLTMGDIHHCEACATNTALIAPDPIRACNGCLFVRTANDAQTFVKEVAVLAFCAHVFVT